MKGVKIPPSCNPQRMNGNNPLQLLTSQKRQPNTMCLSMKAHITNNKTLLGKKRHKNLTQI